MSKRGAIVQRPIGGVLGNINSNHIIDTARKLMLDGTGEQQSKMVAMLDQAASDVGVTFKEAGADLNTKKMHYILGLVINGVVSYLSKILVMDPPSANHIRNEVTTQFFKFPTVDARFAHPGTHHTVSPGAIKEVTSTFVPITVSCVFSNQVIYTAENASGPSAEAAQMNMMSQLKSMSQDIIVKIFQLVMTTLYNTEISTVITTMQGRMAGPLGPAALLRYIHNKLSSGKDSVMGARDVKTLVVFGPNSLPIFSRAPGPESGGYEHAVSALIRSANFRIMSEGDATSYISLGPDVLPFHALHTVHVGSVPTTCAFPMTVSVPSSTGSLDLRVSVAEIIKKGNRDTLRAIIQKISDNVDYYNSEQNRLQGNQGQTFAERYRELIAAALAERARLDDMVKALMTIATSGIAPFEIVLVAKHSFSACDIIAIPNDQKLRFVRTTTRVGKDVSEFEDETSYTAKLKGCVCPVDQGAFNSFVVNDGCINEFTSQNSGVVIGYYDSVEAAITDVAPKLVQKGREGITFACVVPRFGKSSDVLGHTFTPDLKACDNQSDVKKLYNAVASHYDPTISLEKKQSLYAVPTQLPMKFDTVSGTSVTHGMDSPFQPFTFIVDRVYAGGEQVRPQLPYQ